MEINKKQKGKFSENLIKNYFYYENDYEWFPLNIKFKKTDFFGLFDGVIAKNKNIIMYQVKTNKKHIIHKNFIKFKNNFDYIQVIQYLVDFENELIKEYIYTNNNKILKEHKNLDIFTKKNKKLSFNFIKKDL